MWKIDYDAGTATSGPATPVPSAPAATMGAHPLLQAQPKRQMPPMLAAFMGFVMCAVTVFVWEAGMPGPLKLSSNLGALSERLNEAEKRGEIRGATEAQYAYEAKMKALELDLQHKLAMVEVGKQTEIVAAQGRVNAALDNYRALYGQAQTMAQIGAGALAELRSTRASISRDSYSFRNALTSIVDGAGAVLSKTNEFRSTGNAWTEWAAQNRQDILNSVTRDIVDTPDIASMWMNRIPTPDEVEARIKGNGLPDVKLETQAPALPAPGAARE